jgi:uncharacterized OsmC-like protein
VRGITSAENLVAHVEGKVEEIEGVVKITSLHLRYRLKAPAAELSTVNRVLSVHADKCPAYLSVKDSIKCSWEVEVEEV